MPLVVGGGHGAGDFDAISLHVALSVRQLPGGGLRLFEVGWWHHWWVPARLLEEISVAGDDQAGTGPKPRRIRTPPYWENDAKEDLSGFCIPAISEPHS